MIKVTRTKSGLSIVTVKAFGLYANVSFGKSAKGKPMTWAAIERASTRDERNAAMRAADRAASRATGGSLVIDECRAAAPVYAAAYKAALRGMVSARLAAPVKRERAALPFDAFGASACFVLAFSAFLSY